MAVLLDKQIRQSAVKEIDPLSGDWLMIQIALIYQGYGTSTMGADEVETVQGLQNTRFVGIQ
jgi:hypothetical protein